MAVVFSSLILSPLRTNRGSSYPDLPFLSTSSRPSNRPRPPIIVVEYPSRTDMLDTCGCLVKILTVKIEVQITDRRFGRTHVVIYGPTWCQKKRKFEKLLRKLTVEI